MTFHTYIPKPPLSAFVDFFWLYENYADSASAPKERLLPDGAMGLIFDLDDQPHRVFDTTDNTYPQVFHAPVLCGVHSQSFAIDTTGLSSTLGIHFKPSGAFAFFGLPADELHNVHVSLDTLWGMAGCELQEQLLYARSTHARFCILEQTLLRHIACTSQHPAVAFAIHTFTSAPHKSTVADITAQIGLSQRHFIHLFREQVGLTPKLFLRVQRFQHVIDYLHTIHEPDWADLALACGYYDQAHFIRDFQAFSGINPTTYMTQRTDHRNHVPMDT